MKEFTYTLQQLVERFEARREIQNLMGRYTFHYIIKNEYDNFDRFWAVEKKDVCLGLNTGYYSGREAIKSYYGSFYEETVLTAKLLRDKFPEKLEGKTDEEIMGIGLMTYIPLDTPVIEIAADGMTAKGLWVNRGTYCHLESGGPTAYWEWGWIAADFVYENGTWKIWHMLRVDDVDHHMGSKWTEQFEGYEDIPEFAPMRGFKRPEPNISYEVRKLYSADRPFTPTPRVPEPYETFDDTFSYGV